MPQAAEFEVSRHHWGELDQPFHPGPFGVVDVPPVEAGRLERCSYALLELPEDLDGRSPPSTISSVIAMRTANVTHLLLFLRECPRDSSAGIRIVVRRFEARRRTHEGCKLQDPVRESRDVIVHRGGHLRRWVVVDHISTKGMVQTYPEYLPSPRNGGPPEHRGKRAVNLHLVQASVAADRMPSRQLRHRFGQFHARRPVGSMMNLHNVLHRQRKRDPTSLDGLSQDE